MESSQGNITLPEEEGIDIKKYIFLVLSHWWWFAITLFVSLTIAYLVNRYAQNVYSASCSIIIGEQQSAAGSVESMLDELSRVRNRNRKAVVENEITILKSYKMARLALEEARLWGYLYRSGPPKHCRNTDVSFVALCGSSQLSYPAKGYRTY